MKVFSDDLPGYEKMKGVVTGGAGWGEIFIVCLLESPNASVLVIKQIST